MNPAGRDASVAPESIAALSCSVVTDRSWWFAGMTEKTAVTAGLFSSGGQTMTQFFSIADEKKTKLWRTNISRFVIKKGQKSFPRSVYDDQLDHFCFRHS